MPNFNFNRTNAPIERVFDLARSIDFHCHSTSQTSEHAVAELEIGVSI